MDRPGRLQLAYLAAFRTVAQTGSFTRAAATLRVTQPAVTHQIHALERHFGVTLIDVVGRKPRLTEAGTFLVDRVGLFLDRLDALERDMREYSQIERGELRIGATVTIGSYGLASMIARFRNRHPAIELFVTVENTRQIGRRVLRGELSLALVEGDLDEPDLEITPYQDDTLILIAPPHHRLAGRRRPVRAAELAEEPFIAREEGSGTRELFRRAFLKARVEPRVVLSLPTGSGIVEAVEAGLGMAAVSSLFTTAAVAEGRVVPVRLLDVDMRRSFSLVMLKSQTPSPASLAFASLLKAAI